LILHELRDGPLKGIKGQRGRNFPAVLLAPFKNWLNNLLKYF